MLAVGIRAKLPYTHGFRMMKKILVSICTVYILMHAILFAHGYDDNVSNNNSAPTVLTIPAFSKIDFKQLLLEPLQESLRSDDLKKFDAGNYTLTSVKRYRLIARVLSARHYTTGEAHDILPVDLALGWNVMADNKLEETTKINITQSNRYYYWKVPSFKPLSRDEIERNSSNMHLGGINSSINKQLLSASKGDMVYIEGYLVNVIDNSNGYRFISSLTRNDTGAGACEVILVSRIVVQSGNHN